MITILSWGGIGDTLRNIGLVPHGFLFRKFGIRCRVVRRPRQPDERWCPPVEVFEELVERCPSLEWAGAADSPPRVHRMGNRAVREVAKLMNGGVPPYFPFDFRLAEAERAMLPRRSSNTGLVLGVQTHLAGVPSKEWGVANWRRYLELVLSEVQGKLTASPTNDVSIVLVDEDARVEELCFDPRIRHTRGLNIAQCIAVVEGVDVMVSVDSWSKYVAASRKIPQVVVVPAQGEHHTPEGLARKWFEGIFGVRGNTLIGLEGREGRVVAGLRSISELEPGKLVRATLERMKEEV